MLRGNPGEGCPVRFLGGADGHVLYIPVQLLLARSREPAAGHRLYLGITTEVPPHPHDRQNVGPLLAPADESAECEPPPREGYCSKGVRARPAMTSPLPGEKVDCDRRSHQPSRAG